VEIFEGEGMNRDLRYILDGHKAVPVDLMTWLRSFENNNRRVAKTIIENVEVSTVFLGLDHNWGDGPPLLFETMVFGGLLDQEQERYTTWEEAEKGHASVVGRVSESLKKGIHNGK
jgi:hypothetical protein